MHINYFIETKYSFKFLDNFLIQNKDFEILRFLLKRKKKFNEVLNWHFNYYYFFVKFVDV